jgi:hypothetical protein
VATKSKIAILNIFGARNSDIDVITNNIIYYYLDGVLALGLDAVGLVVLAVLA